MKAAAALTAAHAVLMDQIAAFARAGKKTDGNSDEVPDGVRLNGTQAKHFELALRKGKNFNVVLRAMREANKASGPDDVGGAHDFGDLNVKSLVAHYYRWKHTEAHHAWLMQSDKVSCIAVALAAHGRAALMYSC